MVEFTGTYRSIPSSLCNRTNSNQADDVNRLNIIHIAGTEEKGTWIESFLRIHGRSTGFPAKTGLCLSLYLIDVDRGLKVIADLQKETCLQAMCGGSLRDFAELD